MLVGLIFTIFYIVGVKFNSMQPWFGILPEGIGMVGMRWRNATSRISSLLPQLLLLCFFKGDIDNNSAIVIKHFYALSAM